MRLPCIVFALVAALVLVCLSLVGLSVLLRPLSVTLIVAGEAFTVQTRAQTVGELLATQDILLTEGDELAPPPDTEIMNGMTIQVERARPVTLMVDGQLRILRTALLAPGDILEAAGVLVGERDRLLLDGTEVSRTELADWPVPVISITVQRARPVTILEGEIRQTLQTTAATVGEALFEAGVTIFLADTVLPDLNTPVTADLTITIQRARPTTVVLDGERLEIRTQGATVGDALASAGIALMGLDYAIPEETQPLRAGMTIRVVRVEEELLVEAAEIPYETIYQADATLELDHRRTTQGGQVGRQETTWRVRLENGVEVGRTQDVTTIVQEAQNQIITYGTNVVIRTINTPQGPREYWRVLRMYATSYHPAALGGDDITATGRRLTTGVVGSDPDVLPYGTEIYVEGYGVGIIADTGGPRRFPLWVDLGYSDEEWVTWSQYTDVYILTPVPAVIDYFLPG
jgi:uncharacterized protein YabE (DUF348 family)